jgi:uncharacterized protein YkwD
MRRLVASLACAAVLLVGCGGAASAPERAEVDGCAASHTQPRPDAEPALRAALLCLLNAQRSRHGLAPFTEDTQLARAATRHSIDMGRRDYFEHRSPDGVEPWMRIGATGYAAQLVGENLAWGEAEEGTPASAVALWMRSAGHRANVLEPRYTQIGIGIAFDAPEPGRGRLPTAVYTTTFGSAGVATAQ